MPDDALKLFVVRREVHGVHRRHDDARRRLLRGVTVVAPDNTDDRRADLFRKLNRVHQIWADIFSQKGVSSALSTHR